MAPFGFPVLLELSGRRVVVIGALPIHEGKVEALLAGGATDVLVVAESPATHLDALEELEGVRVERRGWRPADLDGAALAIAHDPDPVVRSAIAGAARERRVLANVVDDIPNCDWAMPSIVRRGDLVFAVGTGGASPALSKALRRRLEESYGPEWSEVLRVLREVREETLPALPDLAERARRWSEALDPDEAAALVRDGRADELRARLTARLLGTVEAS
jgi:precorrin-2 dehydrogenase/sirohydrochlorin ferrochelatase